MRGQQQDAMMTEQSPGTDAMDEDRQGSTRSKRYAIALFLSDFPNNKQ